MEGFSLIYVIMSCYNEGKYIYESIQSILAQDLADFELLIVDDGSEDNSINLVQSIVDSRVHLIKLDRNRGDYAARNFGISQSKGKYIAMADAADFSKPERLRFQFDFLEANPDQYCIGTQCEGYGVLFGQIFRSSGDYDFVVRVAAKFKVDNIHQTLVKYLIHQNQMSFGLKIEQTEVVWIQGKEKSYAVCL